MLRRNLIVLAAGLLLLSACGSDVSVAFRNRLPVDTATPADAPGDPDALVTGDGFEVHAPGEVDRRTVTAAWEGALEAMNGLMEAGVMTPLRTGGPAGDLSPYFTADAVRRLTSTPSDRAAFTDEGFPPATTVRKESGVAWLSALADDRGVVRVISAWLDLRLNAHIEGSSVSVAHTGELVLMPEGGGWRIDAYSVRATRYSGGAP